MDRMSPTTDLVQPTRSLYLDLVERCLINAIYEDAYTDWRERGATKKFDGAMRHWGRDWPSCAHTMIGQVRLRNLRDLAEQVLVENVPGDFIETGVWRGGACILLRAVLQAYGVTDRRVFAADSFEGLPKPNPEHYPADAGDLHHTFEELAVSLQQVKANFASYGLLDEQVVFLKGWFKDTLPSAPIEKLAILRIDGDMYESTMEALQHLYDKVAPGGFIIVDDYGCVVGCQQAVDDFRRARNISDPIINIDGWGIFWRNPVDATVFAPSIQRLEPISGGAPQPFWSVVVPLYERQSYLKQCLDSILDQGLGPEEMEIFVIDDASPTNLKEFVEGLGRGRVKYIRNATNLGLYPSTNDGLRRTRGRWIHVLHDDDWIMPDFYTTLKRGIEQAPASIGVAFCMYVNWDEQNSSTWSPPPFRTAAGTMPRDFLVKLSVANPLNLPAVVYRRDAFERIGLFREDLPYTADWEWYVRSALQFDWHYQPEALARYRVHASQQTLDLARLGLTARDIRRTLEIFSNILPREVALRSLPVAREHHARSFFATALKHFQAGNQELAGRFVFEALAIDTTEQLRPEFIQLLLHPSAASIFHDIRAALLRRPMYPPGQ